MGRLPMTIFDPAIIELFAGCFIIGAVVNYYVWCRVRLVLLRQELFAVRDALWDQAAEKGFLGDARYRAIRHRINGCIRGAAFLNIDTLTLSSGAEADELPCASSPAAQSACDEAVAQCGWIIVKYVMFHRASGWFYILRTFAGALSQRAKEHAWDLAKAWIKSSISDRAYDMERL